MSAWNVGIHDHSESPPPRLCPACKSNYGGWYWRHRNSSWFFAHCAQCLGAHQHGFSDFMAYQSYLDKGCYVCGQKAVLIDHDHDVCHYPSKKHSCDKCRRGPACASCNVTLKSGRTPNMLRQQAEFYQLRADRNTLCADALEAFAREVSAK
jgi:hypothetical protein